MNDDHLTEFAGLPVVAFTTDTRPDDPQPPAGEAAWAVRGDWSGEPYRDVFARFMDAVDTTRVTALVIGFWGFDGADGKGARALVEAAARFPNLRAVFLGDILDEEYHISWIQHDDITPLVEAFPELERLEVRGGLHLGLSPFSNPNLKVLRFESGGLDAEIVRAVTASELPALERLDLWFGDPQYGGDAEIGDLAPIMTGERLPALRHLHLCNSVFQDEIAAELASAPVVARLETLGLGMGLLTDRGAEELLAGQPLTHLSTLDLEYHYLSEPMMERLRAALPGVRVALGQAQGAAELDEDDLWDTEMYVAVAE
ncbi:STM4015 family protein [Spirillospora sp. NPDC029432]|uniref:STM4015 family protein n=1 Tax=Spirillospora sp. NPDC029432 TaxID=3154599 RepID=UPI00345152E9